MHPPTHASLLETETRFSLRRAVERLRDGLFDPLAVRILTAHESRLTQVIEKGFRSVDQGGSPHLCVCGSYGQGKSHSLTFIQDRALREGFVCSLINLDPREITFHNLPQIFRALTANLKFPNENSTLISEWRAWSEGEVREKPELREQIIKLLPPEMPYRYRAAFAALAQPPVPLAERQKRPKRWAKYRPKLYSPLLARVIGGETVPVSLLREASTWRQVPREVGSRLTCRGNENYISLMRSFGSLLRQMGYRGWVLLFDEGESIGQLRLQGRAKSYAVLQHFFKPEVSNCGLYPVFAFTEDFFRKVEDEDFERTRTRGELEIPYFERNYAREWRNLTRYPLQDLSAKEWQELVEKLVRLHTLAYAWQMPDESGQMTIGGEITRRTDMETRFKLKGLVEQLDIAQQELMLRV